MKINLSWPSWLHLGLPNETFTQNLIFCTSFPCCGNSPFLLSLLTISNFPSIQFLGIPGTLPLLTLISGSLLLKLNFIFKFALFQKTHHRALYTALGGDHDRQLGHSEFMGVASSRGRACGGGLSSSQAFFCCLMSWPGPSLRTPCLLPYPQPSHIVPKPRWQSVRALSGRAPILGT